MWRDRKKLKRNLFDKKTRLDFDGGLTHLPFLDLLGLKMGLSSLTTKKTAFWVFRIESSHQTFLGLDPFSGKTPAFMPPKNWARLRETWSSEQRHWKRTNLAEVTQIFCAIQWFCCRSLWPPLLHGRWPDLFVNTKKPRTLQTWHTK